MADIITTLHRKDDPSDNVYPNVKDENIPDTIQRKLTAGNGVSISSDNQISASFDETTINAKIGNVLQLNYLDNNDLTNGYYNGSSSTITPISSWYSTTKYIEAPQAGTTLYFYTYDESTGVYSRTLGRMVSYDESYGFISNLYSTTGEIVVPTGAKYLRFCIRCESSTAIYYIMITPFATSPTSFVSFGSYNSLQSQIDNLTGRASSSSLYGFRLLTCGDSVTQGATIEEVDGVRHAYGYWISTWYGMVLDNRGVGGATIATNSTSTQYHFIEHYESILSETNYASQEYFLTLFFGINDVVAINNGTETIGTFDNTYDGSTTLDTNSFIGAYQTILWYILNNDNTAKAHLLVILPPLNEGMITELKKMCIAYGITTYDFYGLDKAGFFGYVRGEGNVKTAILKDFYLPNDDQADYRLENATIMARDRARYLNDTVHPSEFGQKTLARRLLPYLLEC